LGTTLALLNGFLGAGPASTYPSAALLTPAFLEAFSAAILGIGGGIFLQLIHHLLHGRARRIAEEIQSGAREIYCMCLAHGKKDPKWTPPDTLP
jgi:biopolymer transport protein ExbB/TolQ